MDFQIYETEWHVNSIDSEITETEHEHLSLGNVAATLEGDQNENELADDQLFDNRLNFDTDFESFKKKYPKSYENAFLKPITQKFTICQNIYHGGSPNEHP